MMMEMMMMMMMMIIMFPVPHRLGLFGAVVVSGMVFACSLLYHSVPAED